MLILIIFVCINGLWRMDQKPAPDYSEIRQLFDRSLAGEITTD